MFLWINDNWILFHCVEKCVRIILPDGPMTEPTCLTRIFLLKLLDNKNNVRIADQPKYASINFPCEKFASTLLCYDGRKYLVEYNLGIHE